MSFEDIQPFKIDNYFPNGFISWYETFYEVVNFIQLTWDEHELEYDSHIIKNISETQGTGGLYELAKELTDKFELQNKDREWDGEFFDEIDKFLNKELYD